MQTLPLLAGPPATRRQIHNLITLKAPRLRVRRLRHNYGWEVRTEHGSMRTVPSETPIAWWALYVGLWKDG